MQRRRGHILGMPQRRLGGVVLLGACLLAVFSAVPVAGQGLIPVTRTKVSSSGTSSAALAKQLLRSRDAKTAARTPSPKQPCASSNSAVVCAAAAGADKTDEYAALLFATSPMAWSSASPQAGGSIQWQQVVAPAGNQGECSTCAAFAVASAAQTAVATAMYVDVSAVSISVQALHTCPAGSKRNCQTGSTFRDVMEELQRGAQLPTAQCMPYLPDPTGELGEKVCSRDCSASSRLLGQGRFSVEEITTIWQGQRHILMHGAVVSRFDIYPDFRAFFADKRNAKAVYQPQRPRTDGDSVEPHAVVLVGYNNTGGFWIAKNSWGPDWGDDGLFRVAYGECNILGSQSGEAYGITWKPSETPAAAQLPVMPAVLAGCYVYKARSGDFLSRIAFISGIPLSKLLEDNVGNIRDLDAPLAGTQLLLCRPAPGSVASMPDVDRESLLPQSPVSIDTKIFTTPWNDAGQNDVPSMRSVYLDRHTPGERCIGSKTALSSFRLQTRYNPANIRVSYECSPLRTDLGKAVRFSTPANDGGNGNVNFFDRHNLRCPANSVMTSWHLLRPSGNQIAFEFWCAPVTLNAGTCETLATPFNADGGGNVQFLDRHNVVCTYGKVLTGWTLRRHSNGSNYRIVYTCCSDCSDCPGRHRK